MESITQPVKESVNNTLYNWAIDSPIVKKAFGAVSKNDGAFRYFFFGDKDERVLAGISLYEEAWKSHCHFGPLPPISLLNEFENENVYYKDYRDRTAHTISTCLLGLYIYEKNSSIRKCIDNYFENKVNYAGRSNEDIFISAWLLLSLYHDIGYLVENDKVDTENTNAFARVKNAINELTKTPLAKSPKFSRIVTAEKELNIINASKIYRPELISIDNIEKDKFFSDLLNASKKSHLALSDTNGIKEYYIFAKSHMAKYRSAGFRDHGVYSALLLKYIWSSFREYLEELCKCEVAETYYSEYFNEISILNEQLESFSSVVDIAAQAVSLHNINKFIWEVKDTSSHNLDLQSFNIALKDENEAMPLAFMLRLCDELQVWDRPRFRAPSIYDENLKSDDISIVVSDEGIFLRFFKDEEQFVHPDSYSNGHYYKLKKLLGEYLYPNDLSSILRYGVIKDLSIITELPNEEEPDNNVEIDCSSQTSVVAKLAKESDGAYSFRYNNGSFKIYLSKSKASDILSPHMHENMDEVSIITNGSAYACIANDIYPLNRDDAIMLPAGKLHEFIPRTFPCEFITMGNEDETDHSYKTNWDKSFSELDELEEKLGEINDEESLDVFKKVVGFLESEIMEVRWRATEILKQYLTLNDAQQGVDVNSLITAAVQKKLNSKSIENTIIGISMACSFRSKISVRKIYKIMTSNEYFMLPWVCAYYLLNDNMNIDFMNMFSRVQHDGPYDVSSNQELCIYYDRAIIATLQLIKKKNPNLLRIIMDNDLKYQPTSAIPIDEIVLHFANWDTCRQLPTDAIDFSSVEKKLDEVSNGNGERILQGIMSFDHEEERYRILEWCRKQGFLLEVLIIFYTSIRKNRTNKMDELFYSEAKERIKNYLRIIVTDQCNLNCVYCHKEGRHTDLNASDIKHNSEFDLRAVLQVAKESGIKKVKISGGEPLLYPNVLTICSEYQDFFSDIGFTTNGTELSKLEKQLTKLTPKKLTFNVTLNSLNPDKYKKITGSGADVNSVIKGIELLIHLGYRVKINSVITSYNFDEIESLVTFAAYRRIDIKLLDLFTINSTPNGYERVAIGKIKERITEIFRLDSNSFYSENDYLCADVLGIRILLPQRVYSFDCQYNCQMYPCAEGLFGIRVYEDYSCSRCFKAGELYEGTLKTLQTNIERIRKDIENIRMGY